MKNIILSILFCFGLIFNSFGMDCDSENIPSLKTLCLNLPQIQKQLHQLVENISLDDPIPNCDFFNICNNLFVKDIGFDVLSHLDPEFNVGCYCFVDKISIVNEEFPLNGISYAVFSKDKNFLVACYVYNTIVIWSISDAQKVIQVYKINASEYEDSPVSAIAFSPDNRYLVTGHAYGTVNIFDLENDGSLCFSFNQYDTKICGLEFSPNGLYLAVAMVDGYVDILNIAERKYSDEFISDQEDGSLKHIKFFPRGSKIISGFFSDKSEIWNLDCNAEAPSKILNHQNVGDYKMPCGGIAISPNERFVAIGGLNGIIAMHDICTETNFTLNINSENSFPPPIESLDFSCDGNFFAAGLCDGKIKIWNVGCGNNLHCDKKERMIFDIKCEGLFQIAFSLDRRYLFACSVYSNFFRIDLDPLKNLTIAQYLLLVKLQEQKRNRSFCSKKFLLSASWMEIFESLPIWIKEKHSEIIGIIK